MRQGSTGPTTYSLKPETASTSPEFLWSPSWHSLMWSCVCLDPEEELVEEHVTPLSPTPSIPTPSSDRNATTSSPQQDHKEKKKLRDKMIIYTGALGSRDCGDGSETYEDLNESESEDGFEYQADPLFDAGKHANSIA